MSKKKTDQAGEKSPFATKPPTPTERALRHVFTNEESLENAKQLAECLMETNRIEQDFDRVKSDFKSRLSSVDARIGQLRDKVSSGYEIVTTPCEWRFDDPAPGRKSLWRLDTDELVETQEMTTADKQVELPLVPGAPLTASLAPVLDRAVATSRGGVVACEADGEITTDPDENKIGD